MGILSWIVMGLIVGFLAKFIMPGKDPGGIIITILIRYRGRFRRWVYWVPSGAWNSYWI